jgi:hypothetical protein
MNENFKNKPRMQMKTYTCILEKKKTCQKIRFEYMSTHILGHISCRGQDRVGY